jgi:hypothetical protein
MAEGGKALPGVDRQDDRGFLNSNDHRNKLHRDRAQALDVRRIEKNTLKGSFSLALPSGLIVRDCTFHRSGDKSWVAYPSRGYIRGNEQSWANILSFRDRESQDRFQRLALQAAQEAFSEERS